MKVPTIQPDSREQKITIADNIRFLAGATSAFKYYDTCSMSVHIQYDRFQRSLLVSRFDRNSGGDIKVSQKAIPHLGLNSQDLRLVISQVESDCTQFDFLVAEESDFDDVNLYFFECWMKTLDCVLRDDSTSTNLMLDYPLKAYFYGENEITVFDKTSMIVLELTPFLKVIEKHPIQIPDQDKNIHDFVYFQGDYYSVKDKSISLLTFVEGVLVEGPKILTIPESQYSSKKIINTQSSKHHLIVTIRLSSSSAPPRYERCLIETVTKSREFNISRPNSKSIPAWPGLAISYIDDLGQGGFNKIFDPVIEYGDDLLFIGGTGTPVLAKSTEGFLYERYLTNIARTSSMIANLLKDDFSFASNVTFLLPIAVGQRKDKDVYLLTSSGKTSELQKLGFSSPTLDCSLADDKWLGENSISITVLYRVFNDEDETITPVLYKIEFVHKIDYLRQYTVILVIFAVVLLVALHIKYCVQKILEAKYPKEYYPECNKFLLDVSIAPAEDD